MGFFWEGGRGRDPVVGVVGGRAGAGVSGVGVVLAGGCGMVAVVGAVTDLAAGRGAVGDTALASQFCIMLGVVGVVGA